MSPRRYQQGKFLAAVQHPRAEHSPQAGLGEAPCAPCTRKEEPEDERTPRAGQERTVGLADLSQGSRDTRHRAQASTGKESSGEM